MISVSHNKPFFSCLCCTYGRPQYIGEAVQSFLEQTYPYKELVILNTCPRQEYVFVHPQVRVINMHFRPSTHILACHEAALYARGDWFVPWDDDDIWGTDFLQQYADHIIENPECHWFKPDGRFMGSVSEIKDYEPGAGFCHLFTCSRTVYTRTNGYMFNPGGSLFMNDVCDQNLLSAIDRFKGMHIENRSYRSGMVYRWGGISYHHSATGGKAQGYAHIEKRVNSMIDNGDIPDGVIQIIPFRSQDWATQAELVYNEGIRRSTKNTLVSFMKEVQSYVNMKEKNYEVVVDGSKSNPDSSICEMLVKINILMRDDEDSDIWDESRVIRYLDTKLPNCVGTWSWDGGVHGWKINDNLSVSYYDNNDSGFDTVDFARLIKVGEDEVKLDLNQIKLPDHLNSYRNTEFYMFWDSHNQMNLKVIENIKEVPIIRKLKKIN